MSPSALPGTDLSGAPPAAILHRRVCGALMVLVGLGGFFCTLLPMFTIDSDDVLGLPSRLTGPTTPLSGGGLAQNSSLSVDVGFYDLGVTWFGALALPVALIVFAIVGSALVRRPLGAGAEQSLTAAALFGGLALVVAIVGLVRAPVTTLAVSHGRGIATDVTPSAGAGLIVALITVAAGMVLAACAFRLGSRP